MIYKEPLPDGRHTRITFELPAALWAECVNLVGDFNDWDHSRDKMRQGRHDGHWRITLVLATGQEYQFRYLVDRQDWQNDWHADKYAPNGFGTDNSVVVT